MTITKAKLLGKQGPLYAEQGLKAPTPEPKPQVLLESLKERYHQFVQLKNEGLIHQNRHLKMGAELKKTIEELENLILQLGVP